MWWESSRLCGFTGLIWPHAISYKVTAGWPPRWESLVCSTRVSLVLAWPKSLAIHTKASMARSLLSVSSAHTAGKTRVQCGVFPLTGWRFHLPKGFPFIFGAVPCLTLWQHLTVYICSTFIINSPSSFLNGYVALLCSCGSKLKFLQQCIYGSLLSQPSANQYLYFSFLRICIFFSHHNSFG